MAGDSGNGSSSQSGKPIVFIVMGVSGCGKSSIAYNVAAHLKCEYKDGDSLHPESNIKKMSSGEPLTDDDRWPWLKLVREYGEQHAKSSEGIKTDRPVIVTACSALKKTYREYLRESTATVVFIYLKGSKEVLEERMKHRAGHFFKSSMLASQLATLESPEGEKDVLLVSIDQDLQEVIIAATHAVDEWLQKGSS